MPSKNDISQFSAVPKKPILPKSAPVAQKEVKKASAPKPKKPGRKPKKDQDKESYLVALRFTQEEGKILEEKAGMVPLATYLKHFVRDQVMK